MLIGNRTDNASKQQMTMQSMQYVNVDVDVDVDVDAQELVSSQASQKITNTTDRRTECKITKPETEKAI